MSIMSKLSDVVRSLTSNRANTDVPAGADVPSTEEPVPRPDREPAQDVERDREA